MNNIISKLLGVISIIAAVFISVGAIKDYTAQLEQQDWTTIVSEVTDVSSRVVSSGGRRSHSRTVYDISYSYEIDGKTYTGKLTGSSAIKLIGDELNIKYDPEAPENSTTVMSPQLSSLLIPLMAALVFGAVGFCLSGLLGFILKLCRGGKSEPEYIPRDEYISRPARPYIHNNHVVFILQRIVPIIMIALFVLFIVLFSSGKKSASAADFTAAAERYGYTTVNTTQKYREEWKIGSLLEQSITLETSEVRIDFCTMDTLDSAKRLYLGMNLPVADGIKIENDTLYSIENDDIYNAKMRVNNTIVYVYCKKDKKELVFDILKAIGYLEE